MKTRKLVAALLALALILTALAGCGKSDVSTKADAADVEATSMNLRKTEGTEAISDGMNESDEDDALGQMVEEMGEESEEAVADVEYEEKEEAGNTAQTNEENETQASAQMQSAEPAQPQPTAPAETAQPAVPEQPAEPATPAPADSAPESAPAKTYSEAEVIAIYKSTLEAAGMQWYPSSDLYARYPEFGLDGGMGWAISDVPMGDPQSVAAMDVSELQYNGYNMYYIESLGSSDGYVRLKVYRGTKET